MFMLDEFKGSQSVAYNIFINAISNNKLSHAYLIDSNNNPDAMNIALAFAKMIICNDLKDDDKNILAKRIDDGNYLDVKVIESDGIWIKKEELLDLQNEFNKKAIEGNKKIYIIREAEKMNIQTSNSILKFLEEPVDDIIAILLVNNINLVLPTIISRCQVIKLNRKKYAMSCIENFYYLFSDSKYGRISSEEVLDNIDNVINFASFMENNGLDSIIYSKKIWHNVFKDRESCIMAMELLINLYIDVIRYKAGLEVNFYCDKIDFIKEFTLLNDFNSISRKIDLFIEAKDNLKRNLNINLLFDRLIIDMCGDV